MLKKRLSVETLLQSLEQNHIEILPYYDAFYPGLLKQIFDAPAVLFYRGTILAADEACIGIVGTRMISSYGKSVMHYITGPLLGAGCTIVSGLAYGVDAAAHVEAVKQNKRTIAVLGSGLDDDSLYPRGHVRLADDIVSNAGLLLSEYPPGTSAFKHHFVARNRIIAGICLGIAVVECKAKSGALITADYAMDFNRPVYAVPGPIYSPYSEGPNNLLKHGAIPITRGQDILEDLQLSIMPAAENKKPDIPPLQKRVLECMQSGPATIDAIGEAAKLSVDEIISALTILELNGSIKNVGAEGFIKL